MGAAEAAAAPLNDTPVLSDGDFGITDAGLSHRARVTVADAIGVHEMRMADEYWSAGRAA